ncbi:MAG: NYN domain-containing protein, partial [Planctomycetota bacterium]
MRTYVYVDGFNLYYGCLKGTPFRWLDLVSLCRNLLPQNEILKIKYFTAHVKPNPNDTTSHLRQEQYLRALATTPMVEVIFGHFLRSTVWMPRAISEGGKPQYVEVIKTEEKGSDVNLAVHLVNDAHLDLFDVGVVVSNDSDLFEALR